MKLDQRQVDILTRMSKYETFEQVIVACQLGALDGDWTVQFWHVPTSLIRFRMPGFDFFAPDLVSLFDDMTVIVGHDLHFRSPLHALEVLNAATPPQS